MKPSNFPGRKDARRASAAARAEKAGDTVTALNTRAKLDSNSRMVRTKKRRTATATLR